LFAATTTGIEQIPSCRPGSILATRATPAIAVAGGSASGAGSSYNRSAAATEQHLLDHDLHFGSSLARPRVQAPASTEIADVVSSICTARLLQGRIDVILGQQSRQAMSQFLAARA